MPRVFTVMLHIIRPSHILITKRRYHSKFNSVSPLHSLKHTIVCLFHSFLPHHVFHPKLHDCMGAGICWHRGAPEWWTGNGKSTRKECYKNRMLQGMLQEALQDCYKSFYWGYKVGDFFFILLVSCIPPRWVMIVTRKKGSYFGFSVSLGLHGLASIKASAYKTEALCADIAGHQSIPLDKQKAHSETRAFLSSSAFCTIVFFRSIVSLCSSLILCAYALG